MDMHYCTCRINLAGQGFHIVEVLPTEPMSWPEIQVMFQLHGEENVYDIKPIAVGQTDRISEKRRLAVKYRQTPVVEQTFPGRDPNMEMLMPAEPADQPRADEYGIIIRRLPGDDEEEEVMGSREPPTGPAVFKPGIPRPFPRTEA
jgi:hypothetical protein